MTQFKDEHEAIIRLKELRREKAHYESISSWNKNKGKIDEDIEIKIDGISKELGEVEYTLRSVEDSDTSTRFKYLIQQLEVIYNSLDDKYGYPIDRNQGMILENHIYSKLHEWLESSVYNHGFSVPHFYYNGESDFDHLPVKGLIEEVLKELYSIEAPINFIDLDNLLKDIIARLNHVAITEYERNRR